MSKTTALHVVNQREPTANQPPRRLSASGRQLWNDFLTDHRMASSAQRHILCLACESLDLAVEYDDKARNAPTNKDAVYAQARATANRSLVAKLLRTLTHKPRKTGGQPIARGWDPTSTWEDDEA
jgi:hypothetical protein